MVQGFGATVIDGGGALEGDTTGIPGVTALATTGVEIAAAYGVTEALLEAYPELRPVFELFKAGKNSEALEALFKTNYYQNISPTVKARTKQKLEQPGVYKDSLEKYKLAARKRLVSAGIKMPMQYFDALASQAYETGMDDSQFDQLILKSGTITGFGGEVLGDVSGLKAYANSFGVGNYLNNDYWNNVSRNLFAGTSTTEDIQNEIRRQAASAFPMYSTQIEAGISVDAIASAYKGAIASILERDADSITYQDPYLRSALQYVDPKTGQPAVKPLWQFERELKSTKEWEYTDNARDTMDALTSKVLRDMGIM